MPNVTQYIRKEDLEKWNNLLNKAEFIHNALNDLIGVVSTGEVTSAKVLSGKISKPTKPPKEGIDDPGEFMKNVDKEFPEIIKSPTPLVKAEGTWKPIKTPKDAEKAVETVVSGFGTYPTPDNPSGLKKIKLCKIHGTPLTDNGKCLQKGCKFS